MRVLRTFLSSLILLGLAAGIVGLIAREVLLVMAVGVVREAVSEIRNQSVQQGNFVQECLSRGGGSDGESPVSAIQLRFTSDTEFVTEVVCSQTQFESLITSTRELPWMVRKVPGTSGIIWSDARSGIELEVFGRHRAVVIENRTVEYSSDENVDLGIGPVTTCEGYGFTCCALDSQVGLDSQWNQATNCPRSCYSRCVSRPVVLSVATDPYYELETRRVAISSGQSVVFTVLVEVGQASPAQVHLDFGDGQSETGNENTETYTHTYTCSQPSCEYRAKVLITDSKGITSTETLSSSLTVVVTP